MQGTMWKMSAAAAIIGVGFLVMLQVQRAMELSQKHQTENVSLDKYSAGNIDSSSSSSSSSKVKVNALADNSSANNSELKQKNLLPAPEPDGWDNIKPASFNENEKSGTKIVQASNSESSNPWDSFGKDESSPAKTSMKEETVKTESNSSNPWGQDSKETIPLAQVKSSENPWGNSNAEPKQMGQEQPQALFGPEPVAEHQPEPAAKINLQPAPTKSPENINSWGNNPAMSQEPKPLPEFAEHSLTPPPPAPAIAESPDHQKVAYENNGSMANPFFPTGNETPAPANNNPTPPKLNFMEQNETFPAAPVESIKPVPEPANFPAQPKENSPGTFIFNDSSTSTNTSTSTSFPVNNEPAPPASNNPTLSIQNKPKININSPFPSTKNPLNNNPNDLIGDAIIHSGVPFGSLKPELKIEKVAPPKAMLGDPMVYTIIVRNIGQAPAQNVTIEDNIPKGSQLTGTVPRAQLKDKKLIWKYSKLDPNQEETIKVRVIPIEEGEIGSVTTVSFKAEIAAETRITAPRLNISMVSHEQAVVGENILVVFNVKNVGEGDAAGVVLHSVLPPELNHQVGRDLEYEIGNLPAGQTKEVRLALQAVKKGVANISAKVSAKGDISSESKSDIEVIESILVLTRKGPSRRFVGRDASYTMQLDNLSTRDINQVVVKETIPVGLAFVSASSGGLYNPNNRQVTWVVPRIPGKGTFPLEVKLQADSVGDLETVVTATDKEGHQATIKAVTKVEGFAQLGIREVNGIGPVSVGEKASYSFHVTNRGSATATDVKFACIIPDNMKIISAKGPVRFTQKNNSIIFDPIPNLEPNSEQKFEIELTAMRQGEVSMQIAVSSSEMQAPVSHTEAIIVYQD